MAVSADALLNIKANVSGEGALAKLASGLGSVHGMAGKAGAGLKGLAGSAGGLSGAMGALVPLLSGAGLGMMAKNAIDAGDAFWDMSQKTGVSVELLSKFKQAAEMNGSSIGAVEKGLLNLARAMKAAAASAATSDIGGMTKAEAEQAAEAMEASGKRQIRAVEDGEKRQTQAIEREADRKMAALDKETDRRLSALAKRYRREEQLLSDTWDDQKEAAENAAQDQTDAVLKNAQRRYDAQRKIIDNDKTLSDAAKEQRLQALQDAYDKETDLIRDNAAKAQKVRDRAARDAQQQQQDALDERRRKEEEAMKASGEVQKQALKDQAAAQKDIIKDKSDESVEVIKASVAAAVKALKQDPGESGLAAELEDLGLSGKGASEMFRQLGIAVTDSTGALRNPGEVMLQLADALSKTKDGGDKAATAMKLMKGVGAELIPMLNGGRASIESLNASMSTGFAKAAGDYDDKLKGLATRMGELGAKIAIALLPVLDKLTDMGAGFLGWLNSLDPGMQKIILTAGLVGAALLSMAVIFAPVVSAVVALVGALAGASGLGAAMTVVLATVAGFITWPVVLVAGLVAAGVAIFAFRDQIGAFFVWWANTSKEVLIGIGKGLYTLYLEPFVKVSTGIRDVTTALLNWLPTGWTAFSKWVTGVFTAIGQAFSRVFVQPVTRAFDAILNTGKSALRTLLQWTVNAVNRVIDIMNRVIAGYNALPVGDIGYIQRVQMPSFAQGGYVTGPTMAMLGDNASGKEYAVPAEKAVGFAQNVLAGVRGAAAIPSGTSGASGGGSLSLSLNLTTGPVIQLPDGTQALSIEDVERLSRKIMAETVRQIRTPAGRAAAGMR